MKRKEERHRVNQVTTLPLLLTEVENMKKRKEEKETISNSREKEH